MTRTRGVLSLATAALLLAVMSACSDDGNTASPGRSATPTSPTSSSTSTSPAPTPPSDAEAASQSASDLVRTYYDVRDELRKNPAAKLTRLTGVAISVELAAQQALFKRERKDGLHQTGDTQIAELTVQSADLDNSDPKAGRVPTVQVDVCYDVTDVDILDRKDKSIVPDERPDTGWIRYLVSNYNFEADPTGSWRVASGQNLERTPCDPA